MGITGAGEKHGMTDVLYVLTITGFFGLCALFAIFCERI